MPPSLHPQSRQRTAEVYFVPVEEKAPSLPRKDYLKPLILHDGRAVVRPTPLNMSAVLLWVPMRVILAKCMI
uniref:Uncharacterized protein n=1 Tax=Nelumbo nucifera TaxID=4432 RepID=A0A822YWJ4_NELNU|nr:TPA_asm: hypothetical protein HUJ06_007174 [Nelumbo nucifera]